jgi:hypothetical protein
MLTYRPFFMKYSHLVPDEALSCIEHAVVRRAIGRIFKENVEAQSAKLGQIKLALESMGQDMEDYMPILIRMREVPVQPDTFRQSVVREFLAQVKLKSMAKDIIETTMANELPDMRGVRKSVEEVERVLQHRIESGSYTASRAEYTDVEAVPLPTGLSQEIDPLIGVAAGEVGIFLGSPGEGKTTMFANMTKYEAMRGGNPFIARPKMIRRLDQSIMGVTKEMLFRDPSLAERARDRVEEWGAHIEMMDGTTGIGIQDIEARIVKLQEDGIAPTLLMIDYADKLVPPKTRDVMLEIMMIFDELPRLGSRQKVPIWTASQVQREFYGRRKTLNCAAWSVAKVERTASVVGLWRNTEADVGGKIYLQTLKSREGPLCSDVGVNADWVRQLVWE